MASLTLDTFPAPACTSSVFPFLPAPLALAAVVYSGSSAGEVEAKVRRLTPKLTGLLARLARGDARAAGRLSRRREREKDMVCLDKEEAMRWTRDTLNVQLLLSFEWIVVEKR